MTLTRRGFLRTTGTVKSRTYYALQALRRSLNRDGVLNVNVVNEGGVTA